MQNSKTRITFIILALLVLTGSASLYVYDYLKNQHLVPADSIVTPVIQVKKEVLSVKEISYTIDKETFVLKNGVAEKETAPGSAEQNTLAIFGEPVYGDLNGDNLPDAAIMLVNNPGVIGTFYYAVFAINKNGVYHSTNTLLLGESIASKTVNIKDGNAVFTYAVRKVNEPMNAKPSIPKTLVVYFDQKTGQISELVKIVEGEADPAKMTLDMKKWVWVSAKGKNGKAITPANPTKFTLIFAKDNLLSIGTDCNGGGARYEVKGTSITIDQMISTMMACEGSQEQEFNALLSSATSFAFTSKGELVLSSKTVQNMMIFK